MKKFVFVSDFDGTMTERDFYLLIMDKYHRDWQKLLKAWETNQITTFEFLAGVFAAIGTEEQEIIEDILSIQFDPAAAAFVQKVKEAGGDFAVLSAGADYYISKVLAQHGIEGVKLIANRGIYHDKGIQMTADKTSPYYSPLYGVDKGAVIKALKQEYQEVFFAGDSRPDLEAALAADVVFARGELARLLIEKQSPFVPFDSFAKIQKYLVLHENYVK